MILIKFYKKIETSWEELQKKANSIVTETEKSAIVLEEGDVDVFQYYGDYREAVKLGLKTFILHVINEFPSAEEEIVVSKGVFYERFNEMPFEIVALGTNIPQRFDTREQLLSFFRESKIPLSAEDFEELVSIYEEHNSVIAALEIHEYEIYQMNEFGEFERKDLKDYDNDFEDDLDDFDEDFETN
jgi:hypothetical protein